MKIANYQSITDITFPMNIKSTKRLILIKGLGVMVFNATFNNISVISRSVLLVEKPEYPEKTAKLL